MTDACTVARRLHASVCNRASVVAAAAQKAAATEAGFVLNLTLALAFTYMATVQACNRGRFGAVR